jgi:serine phosphatase RsbU (regulator of sigma subunit)
LLLAAAPLHATNLDSIRVAINGMPNDTNKVNTMVKTIWSIRNSDPDFAAALGVEAIELATKLKFDAGRLEALSFTGVCFRNMGDYPKAFEYYFLQMEEAHRLGKKENECYAHINIANLYNHQKKPDEAIGMLMEALKLNEGSGNIGQEAYIRLNLGRAFIMKSDYPNASMHLKEAFNLRTKDGDKEGSGVVRKYLGDIAFAQGNYDEAYNEYTNALAVVSTNSDKDFHSDVLNKIALIFLRNGEYEKASKHALNSLEIARSANVKPRIRDACGTLGRVYGKLGNFKEAWEYQGLYIAYYDSLSNDDVNNRIADFKFELEKKQKEKETALEQERHRLEKAAKDAELENEQNIKYGLVGGLVIFVLLLVQVLRTNRASRRKNKLLTQQKSEIEKQNALIQQQKTEVERQRNEAEEQKKIVEEKQKEILDSIAYAKRIQAAILPTEKYFRSLLPESFVLYLPKDIVAGDFYWMEQVGEIVLFAAADCTGHGVPGAMVSVVCNNALNRSVREYKLTEPGRILDKTRQIVIQEFEKSETGMRDGMDISLCALNVKTGELQWAGANNPLWLVRDGSDKLEEVKGDKQPIGRYSTESPFQNHSIQLQKGDTIYINTDGFQDQFGGRGGKKFKSKRLKDVIVQTRSGDMPAQSTLLKNEFEAWRGDLEQVDDVCVIGVRL